MSTVQRNVHLAMAGALALPQQADIAIIERPPEPQAPDPFAGGEGNRAARRRERFEGHRFGHGTSKHAPSRAEKKAARKRAQAGKKAARKGRR